MSIIPNIPNISIPKTDANKLTEEKYKKDKQIKRKKDKKVRRQKQKTRRKNK